MCVKLQRKRKKKDLFIKANHLVYIVPTLYGSQIYADSQQILFLQEHVTGERILQVTFLAEQKREYDSQR